MTPSRLPVDLAGREIVRDAGVVSSSMFVPVDAVDGRGMQRERGRALGNLGWRGGYGILWVVYVAIYRKSPKLRR